MEGDGYLSNDVPVPVDVDGVEYPSVTHAYWAASTGDPSVKEAIRRAEKPYDARNLGVAAPRRADWPLARLGVMAQLVRLKFEQHPELAIRLMGTRDARIRGVGFSGSYWDAGPRGRNLARSDPGDSSLRIGLKASPGDRSTLSLACAAREVFSKAWARVSAAVPGCAPRGFDPRPPLEAPQRPVEEGVSGCAPTSF